MDSVRIALFDAKNPSTFLILCEADDPDNWKLLGGRFEARETPAQAAERELKEEVGLSSPALVFDAELVNDDGISKRYIYHCIIDPRLIEPSNEISQIRWITADQIPDCKNKSHITAAVSVVKI